MHSEGTMERNAIGFLMKWRITHGEDKARLNFNQNNLSVLLFVHDPFDYFSFISYMEMRNVLKALTLREIRPLRTLKI